MSKHKKLLLTLAGLLSLAGAFMLMNTNGMGQFTAPVAAYEQERNQGSCPNIAGAWKRSDGLEMRIDQRGCLIESRFAWRTISHHLVGSWEEKNQIFSVNGQRVDEGCSVQLDATIQVHDDGHFRMRTKGTDERCGFSKDFHEDYEWIKK